MAKLLKDLRTNLYKVDTINLHKLMGKPNLNVLEVDFFTLQFYSTLLNMKKQYDIDPNDLFLKAKQLKLEFHQYQKFIDKEIKDYKRRTSSLFNSPPVSFGLSNYIAFR